MPNPLVTIVIPAYNAEKTVRQALDSVRAQTFRDWEAVLVDDGSADGTLPLLRAAAAEDGRFRLLQNDRNRGVSWSRNRGAAEARGPWVAFLDSDDLWREDKLQKQLALAERRPDADILYTGYGFLRGSGAPIGRVFRVPEKTDYHNMLKNNVMSTSGVMIRRELLLRYPFRSDVAHEDLFEWLTLLRAGARAAGDPEPLHTVRVAQRESRSGNKLRAARDRMRLYGELGLSGPAAAYYWLCYAWGGAVKYLGLRLGK